MSIEACISMSLLPMLEQYVFLPPSLSPTPMLVCVSNTQRQTEGLRWNILFFNFSLAGQGISFILTLFVLCFLKI